MIAYLSPEWLAEADVALTEEPAVQVFASPAVAIQIEIDDLAYHLVANGHTVRLHAGRHQDPDLVIRQTRAIAKAVARAERNAQAAFIAGEITVHGDVSRVRGVNDLLHAVDRALSRLRSRTEY